MIFQIGWHYAEIAMGIYENQYYKTNALVIIYC